jgi:drug/metabolite transporter (DMT)-like permease
MALAAASLVGAESMLALTPVVIKKSPLDPISAIWSRTLSSAVLGWLLTEDRTVKRSELLRSGTLGFVNLLHIASSYESFRNLPAGQAMSLLYTYPLWNLVFGALFRGEVIRPAEYGAMAVAVVGAALLNTDPGAAAETALKQRPQPRWGLFMGLLMALTESGMHTIMRSLDWKDPAKGVWVLSTSASGWLAALTGLQLLVDHTHFSPAGTWLDTFWLTTFHAITMFSGYWLRFYAIPRLSTVTYSILSYAGLLAAYVFGLLFLGERPGWLSAAGAGLILAAGAALQMGGEAGSEGGNGN